MNEPPVLIDDLKIPAQIKNAPILPEESSA
jgi:hypothetical protein